MACPGLWQALSRTDHTWGRLLSPVPSCCRMFETLSFLPPLTTDQISKQVDYIVQNGRVPW